jgi:hypothetical protein
VSAQRVGTTIPFIPHVARVERREHGHVISLLLLTFLIHENNIEESSTSSTRESKIEFHLLSQTKLVQEQHMSRVRFVG